MPTTAKKLTEPARLPGSTPAGTPGNRRRRSLILPGILLASVMMILAVGCSAASDPGGRTPLPSYAYNSSDTLSAYKVAISAPEALAAVPCYCGCGRSQGHVSLKECYLRPDGSYTDHASNCHLCVAEALDVGKWQAEGVSLKEIRSRIDQKYSDYGTPTNTPPVS